MTDHAAILLNVPLPAGADGDIWCPADPMPHRDIYSGPHCVLNCTGDPLRSPLVTPQAVQWADGSIHQPEVAIEAPATSPALNSDQARELARALFAAAAEVDGWCGR